MKDANTVTAISSATVNGVRGIWAIDGRVSSSQSRPAESRQTTRRDNRKERTLQ